MVINTYIFINLLENCTLTAEFQAVMLVTNNPADILTDKEVEYFKDLDKRQDVSLVCGILPVSRNTVYKGLYELESGEHHEGAASSLFVLSHRLFVRLKGYAVLLIWLPQKPV